jgi:hypothetical protein
VVSENWNRPQVVRALLRVEMADGGVREFEAEHPTDVECHIERSAPLPDLWPVDLSAPLCIDPGAFWGVQLAFRASNDRRHVITVRNETARSPLTVLDEIRAKAQKWAAMDPAAGPLGMTRNHLGAELLAMLDHE